MKTIKQTVKKNNNMPTGKKVNAAYNKMAQDIYKKGGAVKKMAKGGSFPDLNGDGETTYADVLKGRGVFKKGGQPKLGSGERFKKLSGSVAEQYQKKGKSAEEAKRIGAAVAAKAGMKKYGKAKMSKMAQAGKK